MRLTLIIIATAALSLLAACTESGNSDHEVTSQSVAQLAPNTDITVRQLYQILQERDVYLVDVRTPREYADGHLAGTDDLIGYNVIGNRLEQLPENKDAEIIVYCRTARRSAIAVDFLRQAGYTNVRDVLGGITAWKAAGYPVETGMN